MLQTLQNLWNSKRRQQITDPRNIGLYAFTIIVLAISWSTVQAIQANYQLQKKIALLKQQNVVLQLTNENTALQNKFYETDQYLEMAARQNLGLAVPGEKVLLVPDSVALKYVDQKLIKQTTQPIQVGNRSKIAKNLQDWRDFLLGRKLFQD